MADTPAALAEPGAVDARGAALILGVTEAMLDRLPTDAFADDRLYARAQALTEALEAGMAAVARPGQGHRLT